MRSALRSILWLSAACLTAPAAALAQSSVPGIVQESLSPPKLQPPRVSSGLVVPGPAPVAVPSLPAVPKVDQAARNAVAASAPAALSPASAPVSPPAAASAPTAPPQATSTGPVSSASLLGRSQPGVVDPQPSASAPPRAHSAHAAHTVKPGKASAVAKAKPKSAKPSKVAKSKAKTAPTQQG